MALSAEDQRLIAHMEEREFNIKKRQRAANLIIHETRQFRRVLIAVAALAGAIVVDGIFIAAVRTHIGWLLQWRVPVLVAVGSAVVSALVGQALLRTRPGQRLIDRKEVRLNQKYSGDLHAGRRWMQFYYQGEEISCYVPRILYVLESEHRFDSVREALEFVKQRHHENSQAQAHALQRFNTVASQTNLVVLSSVDSRGQPSSRIMRFVTTDRPGVWYATSAPETPKVPEFDGGKLALLTIPTEDGATISSNRVRVTRADKTFTDVADLYRSQVPGYLDGMTDEDQRREIVYELTLRSAKVDSWISHDLVFLDGLGESTAAVPAPRPPGPRPATGHALWTE